jgi:hypothetical protein
VTEQDFVGIAYPPAEGTEDGSEASARKVVAPKQCVVVPKGAAMPFVLDVPDPYHREMRGRLVAPAFVSCLMDDQMEKAPLTERTFILP